MGWSAKAPSRIILFLPLCLSHTHFDPSLILSMYASASLPCQRLSKAVHAHQIACVRLCLPPYHSSKEIEIRKQGTIQCHKLRSVECLPHTLDFGMPGYTSISPMLQRPSSQCINARIVGNYKTPRRRRLLVFLVCRVPCALCRVP